MDTKLASEIKAAGDAGDAVLSLKQKAQAASVAAVRATMAALREHLGKSPLRGLPNIGTSDDKIRAIRVRCERFDKKIDLPHAGARFGPSALCIDHSGDLCWIRFAKDAVEKYDVTDADILPEDAMAVAGAVAVAIRLHLERCDEDAAKWTELGSFAERLLALHDKRARGA